MSLAPGTRLGTYEIVGSLGAGGMGEVYRARDPRLHREVAIKVLPDAVAQDAGRRARFEREARTLASLSHPHIAIVHGLEDASGVSALVMELVEGPTLAEIIAAGPMPIADARAVAVQIADALEAAHEQGIIHRDLKPANIKVRHDGVVKVLDFGLAKALDPEHSGANGLANSPTVMPSGRTEVGIILGTAAYMSPEQARGRAVDKRADIWAFGCVLYEMLSGQQAFAGESTTDVLANIVQREPDWSRLPGDLPPAIAALLRRTLQKNARERLRDIGDARLELAAPVSARESREGDPGAMPGPKAMPVAPAPSRTWAARLGLLAGGAAIATLVLWQWPVRPARVAGPAAAPVRSLVIMPAETTIALTRGSSIALSPDGRQLAVVGRIGKTIRLYLRSLDKFEMVPIAGTEDASNPFFSPDGRWLGFFADGKLKKVAVEGGTPVALADARTPRGETWLADDSILITPNNNVALSRVPALGGSPQPFSTLAAGEMSHRWPRALEGGSAVLFSIWNDTGWDPSRVAVQRTGDRDHHVLVEGGGYPRSLRDPDTGRTYLLYARAEGIVAAPFDVDRLAVTGAPVPVVDNVITNLSGGAHFDIGGGTLAYLPGSLGEADRDLVWVTLDGTVTPARRVSQMSQDFTLSPDGTRFLRNNTVGNRDIWIEDLTRGTSTRVTNATESFSGIWSADAQWIVYARGAPIRNLYRRRLTTGALDERLTTSPHWQEPADITTDGKTMVYTEIDPASSTNIWVLDLPPIDAAGGGAATLTGRPFLATPFSESDPTLSPDGHWVAYQSNDTGRFEIYIRPFPDGGTAHQVSTEGGIAPKWAADNTLFYRGLNRMQMSVSVQTEGGLKTSVPKPLFDATRFDTFFGVAPDAKQFLMMLSHDLEQTPTTVALVQSFLTELRQRVK